MSPSFGCCTLCGTAVLDGWELYAPATWANQFRAVYTTADGLTLSGLGVFNDPGTGVCYAPLDTDKRWSDADFEDNDDTAIPVLVERPYQGRYGFVFHDSCWSLLQEAARPGSVSLQRIFDVCHSLPVPVDCRGHSWGHDFGGVLLVDNDFHFPWEDRSSFKDFNQQDSTFGEEPYQVPEVCPLLAQEPQQPPPWTSTASPSRASSGLDRFQSLPQEVCAAILVLVPTSDALRARLASRAFWPIFYSQQFWASRFLPGGERAWLFEARRGQQPTDWRALYRRTNHVLVPGLRNRQRIWALGEQVLDLVALAWNDLPSDLPEMWCLDSALRPTDRRIEASGLLSTEGQPDGDMFVNGCRLVRTQSVAIPNTLAHMSIDTASFGDGTYVVGMSFTTATGDHIRLGYSSGTRQSIELSQLRGFHLAVGSRGIQGLQCITGPEDVESPWVGSLDDVPRTERLVATGQVIGIEAGFDGCKMVSLSLHVRQPPPDKDLERTAGLRDSAVWYPTVPSRAFCLNEEAFAPRALYLEGYKPLFWCHFGGPGGRYLRHLTGISAVTCLGILRIHFSFDIEVPAEYRSFGRLRINEEDDVGVEEVDDFPIDGPNGERIETVKMLHHYPDPEHALPRKVQEGSMVQCEIFTNRGRSFWVLGRFAYETGIVGTEVTAAPGTAITGLYATERPEYGEEITAMGIMTEDISEVEDTLL